MLTTLSIADTIKDSVLNQFSTGVTAGQMLMSLLISFLMGIFILIIYKVTFRGVLFSKGFAFSLVLLSMVTALIIRTISSDLALSLGMVGALSIVRFRTAVKDPLDTVFMFWSISAGIMAGAGIYAIGVIACLALGVLYFVISAFYKRGKLPYLLVVRYVTEAGNEVTNAIRKLPRHRIKSKTLTGRGAEISVEISLKDGETEIIEMLREVPGVIDVSLVSYEGEFGL